MRARRPRTQSGARRASAHRRRLVGRGESSSYACAVSLSEELDAAAAHAEAHAQAGERVAGVIPTEPDSGLRAYLCSYEDAAGARSWLALGAAGAPLAQRSVVRAAVSIAALCELAEETAGGGQLD